MRRSRIVDTTARLVFHSALVLSVYLVFAGHNQPGGGFVGGLVAGAAITLHFVAGGMAEVRALMPVPPWTVVGTGLLVAVTTAVVPLVVGGAVLESGVAELDLPGLGTTKLTSVLVFDIGVYGVVVGLVAMVLEGFGDDPVPEDLLPEDPLPEDPR